MPVSQGLFFWAGESFSRECDRFLDASLWRGGVGNPCLSSLLLLLYPSALPEGKGSPKCVQNLEGHLQVPARWAEARLAAGVGI